MKFIAIGAVLAGLLAVAFGAFAAHGLKGQISEDLLATFQTGVQYQMYHALAIMLVFIMYKNSPDTLLLWSASLMLAGIVLFSGSLYALALTQIKWFGPITPLGGVCFLLGWGSLLVSLIQSMGGEK